MHHPSVNPSLTPIGFVFPLYKKRVFEKLDQGLVNGDYLAARFWEGRNRVEAAVTPRPAEEIIHTVMPRLSKRGRTLKGDFEFLGRQYLERDIMVLSTFMQWFGTNIGSCFVYSTPFGFTTSHPSCEYTEKYAFKNKHDRIIGWRVHVCTDECGKGLVGSCVIDRSFITDRDRLVVDALMYWLGTRQGREYLTSLRRYMNKKGKSIRNEYNASLKKLRAA